MSWRTAHIIPLLLLVALAFALRFAGLNHGLEHGHIYHPDTSKQVNVANRFMEGRFYERVGAPDYDGYPYFNSLLAAGLRAPAAKLHAVSGSEGEAPRVDHLFIRQLNAWLSVLAVLILFGIGYAMHSRWAGLLAAALFACSPIDVVSCHFANGDTTAAFFTLLALFASLHVFKTGSLWAVGAGSLCVMAAFSSKYSGAAAAIPLATAILLRIRNAADLRSARLWTPGLLAVAGLIVGFFLTTPAAITHTRPAIEDIMAFMDHTSGYNLEDEGATSSLAGRFVYSMRSNLPTFVALLGIPACLGVAAFLWTAWRGRRKEDAVLLSLPAFYIFVGLAMKPAVHPVYHTLVMPTLLLMAVLGAVRIMGAARYRVPARLLGAAMLLPTFLLMLNTGAREARAFARPDTRVLAADWVLDNIPEAYHVGGSKYSFVGDDGGIGRDVGVAWVRSDFREPVEADDPRLCVIATEAEHRLTVFRNLPTEVYTGKTGLTRAPIHFPLLQKLPATHARSFVAADVPSFFRSPLLRPPAELHAFDVFTTNVCTELIVGVLGTGTPCEADLRIGSRTVRLAVPASGIAVTRFATPRPAWPRLAFGHRYPLAARAYEAEVGLWVATTPEDRAALLAATGDRAAAAAVLPAAHPSPYARALHPDAEASTHTLFEAAGTSREFLAMLPYLDIDPASVTAVSTPSNTTAWETPPLPLLPGVYTLRWNHDWHNASPVPERATLHISTVDSGATWHDEVEFLTKQSGPYEARFTIPSGVCGVRARLLVPGLNHAGRCSGIEVRAQPLASVRALAESGREP